MDAPDDGTVRHAVTSPPLDPQSQDRTVRALLTLVDDLTVETEEEGLLEATLAHIVEVLQVPCGATFLTDEAGELLVRAQHGMDEAALPASLALARTALDEGRAQLRERDGGDWSAAAPLITRNRQMGALVLRDAEGHSEAPPVGLLQALGRQLAAGLENARLYAEVSAVSARAQVLNRLTSTLTAGLDLRAVMPAFARELRTLLSFARLACGFVNETGDYIELITHPSDASWGFGTVLPVVGSGPGAVVLHDRPVLQRDLVDEHRYIEDMKLLDEGLRSYLLLPLNSRGRSVGVLALGSNEANAYDQRTLERLQPIADAVAVALENTRLFQKTRELSITDEVTPLFNYRFFHQMLDRELKLVDRYNSMLSVIFMDLDRFKPINDKHGHLRGSRVLREVGFLLRSAVRETDYPARYGGDEFVVILPQTDHAAAVSLAEKLRRLIEGHVFLQEEGINVGVGASLGIATYPNEAATKEALIRLADERMYMDKQDRTRLG
jgi:diguanylate cyclase (GGDEF)-like protein